MGLEDGEGNGDINVAEEDNDEDASEDDDAVQWRQYVDGLLGAIEKQQTDIITKHAELATHQAEIITQLQSLQTYYVGVDGYQTLYILIFDIMYCQYILWNDIYLV